MDRLYFLLLVEENQTVNLKKKIQYLGTSMKFEWEN